MRATRTAVVVAILLLVGARAQAQSLEAAKDLYASAEYDRALAMLDALKLMEHPREEQQAIELHRVLCLVATGKEASTQLQSTNDEDGTPDVKVRFNPLEGNLAIKISVGGAALARHRATIIDQLATAGTQLRAALGHCGLIGVTRPGVTLTTCDWLKPTTSLTITSS